MKLYFLTVLQLRNRMTTLQSYLSSHRAPKGGAFNLVGMGEDTGRYLIPEADYDTFLQLVHTSIWKMKKASSLLESHLAQGPLLIDLDFKYASDGRPLERRFTSDHILQFVAAYAAAIARFVDITALPKNLTFYILTKPAPEHGKDQHKDGIHIQCPSISTDPLLQFVIRGYLLEQNIIQTIFGDTEMINEPHDCFDYSVIHQNNWFLYGACKPDKGRYKVQQILELPRAELTGVTLAEMPDAILEAFEEVELSTNTLDLMKLLSIRRGHTEKTPLVMRTETAAEYTTLHEAWGHGKATPLRVRSMSLSGGARPETGSEDGSVIMTTSKTTEEDIRLAHRLVKECLNPETRCGEYHDWINLAICLKNISDSMESYTAWVDITRRVGTHHKKASFSDAELTEKWRKATPSTTHKNPLRMGSLRRWAERDNYEAYEAILQESIRDWIIRSGSDTHVNVAKLVHKMYEHEFCCSVGSKRSAPEWFYYPKGAHSWKHLKTATLLRARLSDEVWRKYMEAENHIGDILITCKEEERDGWDKKRKFLTKIRKNLETSSFKDSVLKECGEKFMDEDFICSVNMNPNIIGVSNGVIELRPEVVFRPGRPEDNITFVMGRSASDPDGIPYIPYDPDHPTPEHLQVLDFFQKIYPNRELRKYVLLKESACLEGENREQKMWIETGRGSNGKSVKQTLMQITFGDYAATFSTTVLTRNRADGGNANPELIVLRGKRYIYTGEPDIGEKIKTAVVKQITGGDALTVRGLYSDQESIKIMGRPSVACNDLPAVDSTDPGALRRWAVIPHVALFVDSDKPIDPEHHIYHKDLELVEKMKQWRIAFLGILVHYYKTYLTEGLTEPEMVKAATDKYKQDNDTFTAFALETLVVEAGAGPIRMADVVLKYKEWKRTSGMLDMKKAVLVERMKAISARGSTDTDFYGVRFKEDGEEA